MKRHTEVTIWADRIERGKKLRKKKLKDARVFIDYYKGKQWGELKYPLGYKTIINLIFPHIKTQLPSLYFQNPKWFVNALNIQQDGESADIAEKFLNYYVKYNMKTQLKKQIRLAIMDAIFWFGAIKSGYIADIESNKNFGMPKILGYEGETPIYDFDINGEVKIDKNEENVKNEKFVAIRKSPAAFIFDTEGDNCFEEGRYIIEEIIKPYDEVLKNKKYSNTKGLEATFITKIGLNDIDEKTLKTDEYRELYDDLKRIVLYEIYDLDNNKLKVVAEGGEKFLRDDDMPESIDRHPYSFLVFNTIPDEIYPISDIDPLRQIQDNFNIERGLILEHAKRDGRKYGYIEGMIDDDEMEKLKSPEDGTLFKVKELPLGKCIEPLADAPLDPTVYASFGQSKEDFREVGGSTESERGVVERRKTAYEASKINEGVGLRKADRRSLVEDFSADVGHKLVTSMQANMESETTMPEGETVNQNKNQGKFKVSVEVGSCAPKIPEFERQDIVALLQTLPMFPQEMVQVTVNFGGLLKAVARSFDTMEESELINTPEDQKRIQGQIDQMKQVELAIKSGIDKKGQTNAPV